MNHLPEIIRDLALILVTASFVCLIFARIKLPVVIGYLMSGFLLSPTMTFFPNVLDQKSIQTWAEIGIIFMMFNLGIEFSFRRLGQLGSRVLIIGLTQVTFAFLLGFKVSRIFGLNALQSLFLASMVCVASTAVIIKAFEEFGIKTKQFAQVTLGVLVFEDLAAMLLLVFLTTLGKTQEFQGIELMLTTVKLLFYLAVWLTFGLFAIPAIIRYSEKFITDEIALVVSIGLCFGMVALSVQSGFSPALGAFVMGSIFAETAQRERIEKLLHPIKDLFSAIFFVSIGLLVKPEIFIQEPLFIIVLCLSIVIGNLISVMIGGILSGLPLKSSIHAGLSLSQIGEFSFIIAGLGMSFGVLEKKYLSMIVAVAVLTTLITPFLIKNREKISDWIEGKIPHNIKNSIQNYGDFSESIGGHQKWRLILKDILTRVFLNGSIIVALFILISRYLAPILRKIFTNIYVSELLILLIALLAAAPFFWGMVLSKNLSHEMVELYQDVVTRRARKFIFYLRSSLALILCFLIIFYGLSLKVSLFLVFVILWGYYFFFRRYMGSIYRWFEKGLSTTYESQETHSDGPKNQLDHQKLAPWNQQLEELEVPPMSLHVGKTLEELSLRERCGVNIALIKRGEMTIAAPHKNDRIFPYDKLYAIGDEKAMESFFQFFKSHLHCDPEMMNLTEVSLLKHQVLPGSSLIGRTIRESGIRERTKALVVGIERQGQRILSPDSQLEILVGDLLLLVGDRSKVEWIEHVNPSH